VGSFNFSEPADLNNGEHLLVIEDQRVARAYMVEALRLFDHYEFRAKHDKVKGLGKPLRLAKPPRTAAEQPWWREDWQDVRKIKDRELFS
jgi:phosphatidylserine/phosphatidylglycerophosphate/cardiolipin synthase-like enzyme